MKWIRKRVLDREILSGTFLGLGSGLTAEIAGQAGYDFVVIDLEHGAGVAQLMDFAEDDDGRRGSAPACSYWTAARRTARRATRCGENS